MGWEQNVFHTKEVRFHMPEIDFILPTTFAMDLSPPFCFSSSPVTHGDMAFTVFYIFCFKK